MSNREIADPGVLPSVLLVLVEGLLLLLSEEEEDAEEEGTEEESDGMKGEAATEFDDEVVVEFVEACFFAMLQ